MSAYGAVLIVSFILMLIIEFVFYGFGSACQYINQAEVERKANEENDKYSQRLMKVMLDPNSFIGTIQVVVTFIQFVIGAAYVKRILSFLVIFTKQFDNIFLYFLFYFISVCVVELIVLVLAVFVPKKLARKYPEAFAYFGIKFTYFICILMTPFTFLVNTGADGILMLFGMKNVDDISDVTQDDIMSLVDEGHEQGVLDKNEAVMIHNIFEFGDKTARDIMTNRQNVVLIDSHIRLSEAVNFVLSESHSRFPVCNDTLDEILGILHMKDALRYQKKLEAEPDKDGYSDPLLKNCRQILRKPEFVPETIKIDDLFHSMQKKNLQLVVVVDEYGQTEGIITMEDILEEIVGNIQDEYDEEEKHIIKLGPYEYIARGDTELSELTEKTGISFEDIPEVETLNGFVIINLQHIPEENEKFEFEYKGHVFEIKEVMRKMVKKVRIRKLPPKSDVE